MHLTEKYIEGESDDFLFAVIAAYLFIVAPIAGGLAQLFLESNREWVKDDDLKMWINANVGILYFLSIFSGSSFIAVMIVNCGAFQLDILNMGMSRRQRMKFHTKRIWSVVFCEVEGIIQSIQYPHSLCVVTSIPTQTNQNRMFLRLSFRSGSL